MDSTVSVWGMKFKLFIFYTFILLDLILSTFIELSLEMNTGTKNTDYNLVLYLCIV
jgi:hypothetical protein